MRDRRIRLSRLAPPRVQAWNDADIAALTGPDRGGTNSPGVGYRGRNARLNTPADREAALNAFFASMVR